MIHVLVVDDSAVVRQGIAMILARERDMTVSVAADPIIAMGKMKLARPDVIILDLEMPRMDGLSFLRRLMRDHPLPVVVCSGAVGKGTEAAFQAMDEGAVEVIAKPRIGVRDFLEDSSLELAETVRAAATSRSAGVRALAEGALVAAPAHPRRPALSADVVVAIGASTGGPEALSRILHAMPVEAPPIVVVQHMPKGFTAAFAARLARTCTIDVKEAETGDKMLPGRALIAAGDRHLRVVGRAGRLRAEVADGPPVSRHRPSVDVLFRSVAEAVGAAAVGVVLTGMGDDGAAGLLEMRGAGGRTIAQDEATSVVFGMPRSAIARGAATQVVPLGRIAEAILTPESPAPGDGFGTSASAIKTWSS
jgi:two-component system chemotaxis response regulator CheB